MSLYDRPRLILIEFWSSRSRESRKLSKLLAQAYEFYKGRGLLVVALTSERCGEVEKYLHREKIEYKVGAESRSAKDYEVEALPAVILIDPKGPNVIARWEGNNAKAKPVAQAIRDFLGPPPGTAAPEGHSESEIATVQVQREAERENTVARMESKRDDLMSITSRILDGSSEIPADALADLDQFYEANLSDEALEDSAETRAQTGVRCDLLISSGQTGYQKLFASGRLSEPAKSAIRDQVFDIARSDSSPSVRMYAARAVAAYTGRQGNTEDIDALRNLLGSETDPLVKANLEDAVEKLSSQGPPRKLPPTAPELTRMLNSSKAPGSSAWAEAYAYKQTVTNRATEQLLQDYDAFPDPTGGDETARQNAVLKRDAAIGTIEERIANNAINDLRPVKKKLTRIISEESDSTIRNWAIWSGLKPIAERGGGAAKVEILEALEKRMATEPDRHVKATIETTIKELKGK